MKSPVKNVKLTSYDDLFNPQAAQESGEKIVNIPLSQLYMPKIHPFQVRDDAEMQDLVNSIDLHGVLAPGIARPLENGGYELVSGNRRKRASELLGRETLPVIVREMDDDAAIILMVDSNLQQRNSILPSEKAFAYKMKLEAIKHQGSRTDLTSGQVVQKLSVEKIAEGTGESYKQIQRYIRLTELIPDLLEIVDAGIIKFNPAVELSYLAKEEQMLLCDVIDRDEVIPSLKQAQELRHYSKEGKLSEDVLTVILNQEKPIEHKITLDGKWVQQRFPKTMTPQQIKERINKALDLLERTERQRKQREER